MYFCTKRLLSYFPFANCRHLKKKKMDFNEKLNFFSEELNWRQNVPQRELVNVKSLKLKPNLQQVCILMSSYHTSKSWGIYKKLSCNKKYMQNNERHSLSRISKWLRRREPIISIFCGKHLPANEIRGKCTSRIDVLCI